MSESMYISRKAEDCSRGVRSAPSVVTRNAGALPVESTTEPARTPGPTTAERTNDPWIRDSAPFHW